MKITHYFLIIIALRAGLINARVNTGCSDATITTTYDSEKRENVTKWHCDGFSNDRNTECFLGSTIVYDKDGNKQPLREVTTGSTILDGEGKPTKVVGWLHQDSQDNAKIVRIEDFKGGVIEISHRHLLFNEDGVTRFAESFGAGERLSLGNDDYITVMDIRTYIGHAIWMAPITESGTIRVGASKVKASCYAEIEHHTLAHYYVKVKHFVSGYDGSRPHFDHRVLRMLKWVKLA